MLNNQCLMVYDAVFKSYRMDLNYLWVSLEEEFGQLIADTIKPGAVVYLKDKKGIFMDTYIDEDCCVVNCCPMVANAEGKFPECWVMSTKFDIVMSSSTGELIQIILDAYEEREE